MADYRYCCCRYAANGSGCEHCKDAQHLFCSHPELTRMNAMHAAVSGGMQEESSLLLWMGMI